MRDILEATAAWFEAGRPFALATVVATWGSSPRPPGASMAVDADGEVVGSVSGGCVEGAVYEAAQSVLATGVPSRHTFGVSDDDAFAVGLTCGGTLEVAVERVDATTFPQYLQLRDLLRARTPVAVATLLPHPANPHPDTTRITEPPTSPRHLLVRLDETAPGPHDGTLGDPGLDHAVAGAARGLLEHGSSRVVHTGPAGEQRRDSTAVFVESFAPPPTMYVFGAIDFAAALVRTAKQLGYHIVVCDARGVFATARRFPDADEVVVAWPHRYLAAAPVDERSVICVLTHDPTYDVPLLEVALGTRAAYIGAMGSRSTHADRLARLRDAGVEEAQLKRLFSPIGLDLGARTPEETAISIVAEVIATTCRGTGRSLRDLDAPIHR